MTELRITHAQAERFGELQRTQRDARAEGGELLARALHLPIEGDEPEPDPTQLIAKPFSAQTPAEKRAEAALRFEQTAAFLRSQNGATS